MVRSGGRKARWACVWTPRPLPSLNTSGHDGRRRDALVVRGIDFECAIDHVAGGAGATRATFYLHFRTKADLIAEVMGIVRADAFELNSRLEAVMRAGDR